MGITRSVEQLAEQQTYWKKSITTDSVERHDQHFFLSASRIMAVSVGRIGLWRRQKSLILELVQRPGTGLGKRGYGQVRLHRNQMSGVGIGLSYESR
jgi:hypothetical protein